MSAGSRVPGRVVFHQDDHLIVIACVQCHLAAEGGRNVEQIFLFHKTAGGNRCLNPAAVGQHQNGFERVGARGERAIEIRLEGPADLVGRVVQAVKPDTAPGAGGQRLGG